MAVRMVDAGILGRICDAARAYLNLVDEVDDELASAAMLRKRDDARRALDDLLTKAEIFQS